MSVPPKQHTPRRDRATRQVVKRRSATGASPEDPVLLDSSSGGGDAQDAGDHSKRKRRQLVEESADSDNVRKSKEDDDDDGDFVAAPRRVSGTHSNGGMADNLVSSCSCHRQRCVVELPCSHGHLVANEPDLHSCCTRTEVLSAEQESDALTDLLQCSRTVMPRTLALGMRPSARQQLGEHFAAQARRRDRRRTRDLAASGGDQGAAPGSAGATSGSRMRSL